MSANKTFSYSIDVLPEEMLVEILTHLTAEERMAARWTCRRWRNACNQVFIQKKEKLRLEGITHLEDIVPVLLATERVVLNLKFVSHLLVARDNWSIWWHCGPRIQQLEFENCAITYSSLQAVLANCTKLSLLALRDVRFLYGGSVGCFSQAFIQLNQHKVIASSVETFIFNVQCDLTLPALSAMGSIFPNVKNIDFNFYPEEKDRRNLQPLSMPIMPNNLLFPFVPRLPPKPKNYNYSSKKFIECLTTGMQQLEHLTLNTLRVCSESNKSLQETEFKRLKTVKLYSKLEILIVESKRIYFPRECNFSTSPRTMNVTSIQFFDDETAENVIKVLQELPNLKKIKVVLSFVTSFEEFTELYKAFANSKLVSLHLINELEVDWHNSLPQILDDTSLPTNTTVRKLKITNLREENLFMDVFLKCFSAVDDLKMTVMDKGWQFTNIFNQRSLKCVQLQLGKLVAVFNSYTGFFGYPIREIVENVEYLNVTIDVLQLLIFQKPQTFFKHLRFLHIAPRESCSSLFSLIPLPTQALDCLPLKNLEGVYFNVDGNTEDVYKFFAQPSDFPNIKYIGINIVHKRIYTTEDIAIFTDWFKPWFQTCLRLRAVFLILVKDEEGICFSYDKIRGEIREFRPEQTFEGCYADSKNGISMFNYFKNLKSFRKFWASHS